MQRIRWARNSREILALQVDDGNGIWIPYTQSKLFTKDYQIQDGTLGYATMQACLKAGYVYALTEHEYESAD